MENMLEIQSEIFEYLIKWSTNNRYKKDVRNPYFYMRTSNDKRFRQGYWFPGNDDYTCISFWTGGDTLNKTPNIYFEIHKKYGCRVMIVARDSEGKAEYFSMIIDKLNATELKYVSNRKGIWIRQFSDNWLGYRDFLNDFVHGDKDLIDGFISDNDPKDYIDEFSSSFGFIDEISFENAYARVKQQKDILDEEHKLQFLEQNLVLTDTLSEISEELTVRIVHTSLPLSLKMLDVKNYQGVRHIQLTDLPDNSRWIFITGENGYGKSTVLQSIALGLFDDPALNIYMSDESRIELCIRKEQGPDDTVIRLKSGFSSKPNTDYRTRVIGYGPVRLNTMLTEGRNISDRDNNVLSLFNSAALLKNLQYELFAKRHTNINTFEMLTAVVKEVTSGRIDGIAFEGEKVLFIEKLSNGDLLPALPLDNLAAGFRSIINIVGDIIVRFSQTQQVITYKDYSGIVLIDEIENHLHPVLQRELPQTLTNAFPNIQFIATTHSPIPLLGAPSNAVILTINRTAEDGITVERLDEIMDFANLLPNTILSSPIFGLEKIIPNANTDISHVETVSNYKEAMELSAMKKTLNLKEINMDHFNTDNNAQHR